jgi:hypothetical protein
MILGKRGRRAVPRCTPELDDLLLGNFCRQIRAPVMPGAMEIHVASAERLMEAAHADWDRLMHRMAVLARQEVNTEFSRSWLMRQPRRPDALIFRSRVIYERMRADKSFDEAKLALSQCLQASSLRPEDPTPWVVMLGIYRLLGWPERAVSQIWREVINRDAWNREAHLQVLSYLLATDDASYWRVDEFLDSRRQTMPANAPTSALELTAAVGRFTVYTNARPSQGGSLARYWWSAPKHRQVLDLAVDTWLRPGFLRHAASLADLNILAFALVCSGDFSDASAVFASVGPVVTEYPWSSEGGDPVKQFLLARAGTARAGS